MNELENMSGLHEHNFLEEKEPTGRLFLGPCLSCGLDAGDAMKKAQEELNEAHKKLLTERMEREKLEATNKRMQDFLTWLFDEVFNGSPDGGDIQDKAEEIGLLVLCKVDRNDERYKDHCDEYDTDEMYFPRWTEEAKKALSQSKGK